MHVSCKTGLIAAALLLPGASSALAADGKACTAPDQPLRPVMATHTQPPYPEMSVMTSEEGTTLLQVAIGADGVPTKTFVVQSSGSVRLDEAAIEHVNNTWRWNAPVIKCQPMAMETRISIKWDLHNTANTGPMPPSITMNTADYPAGALQRREQGITGLMVMVLADGQVSFTRVMQSSGFPELDAKSQEIIKTRWRWTPATLEGKAVNTAMYVISVWKIDGNGK
jgi:TonB family protein